MFQGVTSLGGTERIRYYDQRYRELWDQYTRLCSRIDAGNTELLAEAKRLKVQVRAARKTLKRAARLLRQCQSKSDRSHISTTKNGIARKSNFVTKASRVGLAPSWTTVAGGAAGTAFAATSWGLVQVLGHTSTGTAIAGLHGAAAWNGGWAWFGGGSLASGGGGIAAGHMVLPGIGTAVAVAVSSYLSHKEANKLAAACDEIEQANDKNQKALATLNTQTRALQNLARKVCLEHRALADNVDEIYRRTLPLGLLSHLIRLIVALFTGNYFKAHEYRSIEQLEFAVQSFMEAFV